MMTIKSNRLRTLAFCGGLLALMAELGWSAAQPAGGHLPSWEKLDFTASKLMITARSSLTAEHEPIETSRSQWAGIETGRRSERDIATTVRLGSETSFLGRASSTTVWINPKSLGAFQRTLKESGSRTRQKIYRFSDTEAIAYRSEPAGSEERQLDEPQWTKRGEQRIKTPPGTVVTDPLTLFYLISTHPLTALDKGIEVDVLTRNRVTRVRIRRTATAATVGTRSTVVNADGRVTRDGKTTQIPVRIYEVVPIEDNGDLRLLGLEGAIEVAVDEALRMPVEIRGKIPPVGRVTVKLRRASLR